MVVYQKIGGCSVKRFRWQWKPWAHVIDYSEELQNQLENSSQHIGNLIRTFLH